MMIIACVLATLVVAYLAIGYIVADFTWIYEFMDNADSTDRARILLFTCALIMFGAMIGMSCS